MVQFLSSGGVYKCPKLKMFNFVPRDLGSRAGDLDLQGGEPLVYSQRQMGP